MKTITNEEADEHFVIVLSDANLDRYGIRPRHLTDALTANEDVNAFQQIMDMINEMVMDMMDSDSRS